VAGVVAERFPPADGEEPPVVTGYAYSAYRDPPLNYTIVNNVMVGMVSQMPPPPRAALVGVQCLCEARALRYRLSLMAGGAG
jgi:hypothetical protein